MVSEKEFAVINEIANNNVPSQRSIAQKLGISLGLTNLLIKRLVGKGYIKAKQLNKKKIKYFLAPKGLVEKANKSYNFTLRTINLLRNVRQKIQSLILKEYENGVENFIISGKGELSDIAVLAFGYLKKHKINYTIENANEESLSVLILVKDKERIKIDLIKYLSEIGISL
ncbi:winged helix-turn-helix transcriptional regulator [Elusimicrobiota bacterium]